MEEQQTLLNELSEEEKVAFLALIEHVTAHRKYLLPIIAINPSIPDIAIKNMNANERKKIKKIENIKNRYCKKMGIEDSFFAKKYSPMDEILDKFGSEKSKKIVLAEMIKFLSKDIFDPIYFGYSYLPKQTIINEIVTKFDLKDFMGKLVKNPKVAKKFRLDLNNLNIYF